MIIRYYNYVDIDDGTAAEDVWDVTGLRNPIGELRCHELCGLVGDTVVNGMTAIFAIIYVGF